MKKEDFLRRLKKERIIEIVEPSKEISHSYKKKSQNCLDVAKLAHNAGYFENAIGEAYYAMYNSLQSMFYFCGVKCENHSGAALLLKKAFNHDTFFEIFSYAKKERIDKQYYVTPDQTNPVTKESSATLILAAGKFILEIEAHKIKLTLDDIKKIRNYVEEL